MPRDHRSHDDDIPTDGSARRFSEFECPVCSAQNPQGDPIRDGDDVRCAWCGLDFAVHVSEEGKLKLKEI